MVIFRDAVQSALRDHGLGDRAVLLPRRQQGVSRSQLFDQLRRQFGAPGDSRRLT